MNELELEILYTAKTIRKIELEEYRKNPCDSSRSKLFRAISFLLGISRSALISNDIAKPVYDDIEEELRYIARDANDIFMHEEKKTLNAKYRVVDDATGVDDKARGDK